MKAKTTVLFLLSSVVLMLCGCASPPQPPQVVVQPVPPEEIGKRAPLEMRFERVFLKKVPIGTAMLHLGRANRNWPQKIPRVEIGIDGSAETVPPHVDFYPKVTLDMRDVTMDQVLDEMCRQTGWAKQVFFGGLRVLLDPTPYNPNGH